MVVYYNFRVPALVLVANLATGVMGMAFGFFTRIGIQGVMNLCSAERRYKYFCMLIGVKVACQVVSFFLFTVLFQCSVRTLRLY